MSIWWCPLSCSDHDCTQRLAAGSEKFNMQEEGTECACSLLVRIYCNLDSGKNLKGIVWKQSCHTSQLEGLLILLARIWVAFMASIIRSEICFFRGRAGSCTSDPLEGCREFIWVQVRSMRSSMDKRNDHVVDQVIISFHSKDLWETSCDSVQVFACQDNSWSSSVAGVYGFSWRGECQLRTQIPRPFVVNVISVLHR